MRKAECTQAAAEPQPHPSQGRAARRSWAFLGAGTSRPAPLCLGAAHLAAVHPRGPRWRNGRAEPGDEGESLRPET